MKCKQPNPSRSEVVKARCGCRKQAEISVDCWARPESALPYATGKRGSAGRSQSVEQKDHNQQRWQPLGSRTQGPCRGTRRRRAISWAMPWGLEPRDKLYSACVSVNHILRVTKPNTKRATNICHTVCIIISSHFPIISFPASLYVH